MPLPRPDSRKRYDVADKLSTVIFLVPLYLVTAEAFTSVCKIKSLLASISPVSASTQIDFPANGSTANTSNR